MSTLSKKVMGFSAKHGWSRLDRVLLQVFFYRVKETQESKTKSYEPKIESLEESKKTMMIFSAKQGRVYEEVSDWGPGWVREEAEIKSGILRL